VIGLGQCIPIRWVTPNSPLLRETHCSRNGLPILHRPPGEGTKAVLEELLAAQQPPPEDQHLRLDRTVAPF
jgi:hypothetical protein